MGANFKICLEFISFLAFIGLYLTTPLVKADLPNKDVMKAAACMREVFGDDIALNNTRNGGNILTNAEFFGIMCIHVSEENLCKEIEKNTDEDYNGSAIKGCLEDTGDRNLFQKYVELGQTLASPSADETLKQDDVPPQKPETQQKSPANDDSEESEDDISQPTSPQNPKLNSPVVYFKRGACESGMNLSPVEFTELKNEKDEKDAIQCLRECTSKFLSGITKLLDEAKEEAINSSSIGLSEEEMDILYNIPESSKKFKKDKFDSELDESIKTTPLSTNPIEIIGKKYLFTYDELHNELIKYKTEKLNKKRHMKLGYLDVNLFGKREMYQICAQLECSMTTNSIPLYNLMEAGTHSHESEWQRFCRVLMIDPEITSVENSQQQENVD